MNGETMCIHLDFNYKKATQALNFYADKDSGCINKMKAIKLIFLADRYHLRKYGRPIINDEYFAMPYGPVASGVKDIAEMSGFLGDNERSYAEKYLTIPDQYNIKSTDKVDFVFSKSNIEALEFSWDNFGNISEYRLSEITHEFPEWKKHKAKLEKKSRVRMSYEDFFDDPPEHIEKCHEISADEKLEMLEYIEERSHLEALWS